LRGSSDWAPALGDGCPPPTPDLVNPRVHSGFGGVFLHLEQPAEKAADDVIPSGARDLLLFVFNKKQPSPFIVTVHLPIAKNPSLIA
jgi:hypothetical protein